MNVEQRGSWLCRRHRHLVAAALNEIGVHVGQEHVVFRLAIEEGMTQSQLAEALCLDASTVTKMLPRLERDGVIERQPDAADARISRVYLTPTAGPWCNQSSTSGARSNRA